MKWWEGDKWDRAEAARKKAMQAGKYAVHDDLKRRARGAGLTARELAAALGEPPSTTSNRLNGFAAMSKDQKSAIIKAIEAQEAINRRRSDSKDGKQ